MWYWSRSRQEYWCKGETSGDRQYVREALLRLRRRRPAVRGRAGGPGRVPHRRAQLLLPRLRRRGHPRPGLSTAVDERRGAVARRVRRAGARSHRRARVARGAGRPRDPGLGVREARRRGRGRPARVPARVGGARRTLGPVLVPRPRSCAHPGRAGPVGRVRGHAAARHPRPIGARSPRSKRCCRRTARR